MQGESLKRKVRIKKRALVPAGLEMDFERIVNRSPGLVDVYHYPSGAYVYVSPAITYTLGYEPADMLNGGLEFFISKIHPDDLEGSKTRNEIASKSVEKLEPGVDDTKPFANFEYRVRHKDGNWVWLHTDASVFGRTPAGELEYIINTCVDISEQKSAEDKLRQAAKQLRTSQAALRAEHDQLIALNIAKDEFVSIASHQLRTPATGVKQYIGLLMQGYGGEASDAQMTILQAALDCNERQLVIIADLLNTSRMEAGMVQPHKKQADLAKLLRSVVKEQQEKYQARKQKLTYVHTGKPVKVFMDERLIRMVIENLLDNASKYSSDGKRVDVSLTTQDGTAVVTVKDYGFGIPKDEQKKLFQKFSRIQSADTENVAGTGLGLYWAKKVIDLHKGTIALESSTKRSTVFSVTLPRKSPKSNGSH